MYSLWHLSIEVESTCYSREWASPVTINHLQLVVFVFSRFKRLNLSHFNFELGQL
jgi:hypothetical protein